MSRIKEKKEIIHEPSTQEIFRCLSDMPKWSELLLTNGVDKIYKPFLQWLIEENFFNGRNERRTIKQIANGFKTETTKVTKWLHEIYDDIFELNENSPELFQTKGINVELFIRYFDNCCSLNISLPALPREFETFQFPFVAAKIGVDFFWIKKIEHIIEQDKSHILITLQGGLVNKYREFALEKALFQKWISYGDLIHKHSFEIDDELIQLFRH